MIFYKKEILRKRAGAAHGLAAGVPSQIQNLGGLQDNECDLAAIGKDELGHIRDARDRGFIEKSPQAASKRSSRALAAGQGDQQVVHFDDEILARH